MVALGIQAHIQPSDCTSCFHSLSVDRDKYGGVSGQHVKHQQRAHNVHCIQQYPNIQVMLIKSGIIFTQFPKTQLCSKDKSAKTVVV